MKKKFLYALFLASGSLMWTGCSEDELSKGYDIDFPVAMVYEVSDNQPYVDEDIMLKGENLNTVTSVSIGAYTFKIKSASDDGGSMIVTVPRSVEAGMLTLVNKYKREYDSDIAVAPQFFEAKVQTWPSEIQKGKPFTLKGENMDLIKDVKINGKALSVSGTPSTETASYATLGLDIEVNDEIIIEVTPKAGDKQSSDPVKVVVPKETFSPKQTLRVIDVNGVYTIEDGSDRAKCTIEEVSGLFGKALRVSASKGNGWDGTYCKIFSDNEGKGFDLSAYNKPHITLLINSNGGEGYVQPLTYDADNGEQDRHLTGAFGYGDDYKSVTDGWEWRSYDLEALGFPIVKGKIDKIGIQFRGGNVGNGNDTPFDMSVNMVMITDGPLNPTVAWDCETDKGGSFVLKDVAGSSLDGVCQGARYASFMSAIKGSWDWMGDTSVDVDGLDPLSYNNGIWFNMLINTGNNEGYCQIEFAQGGSGLTWFNFIGTQGYGDDYKFVPTGNEWKWRSVRINPESFNMDASQPFAVKIGATTGNLESGTYELNVDYLVFTAAPMDPDLNTDDL